MSGRVGTVCQGGVRRVPECVGRVSTQPRSLGSVLEESAQISTASLSRLYLGSISHDEAGRVVRGVALVVIRLDDGPAVELGRVLLQTHKKKVRHAFTS